MKKPTYLPCSFRTRRLIAAAIAMIGLAFVLPAVGQNTVGTDQSASARVPGQYRIVDLAPSSLIVNRPIAPHSLDVATLDIYESFQCPHCQAFYPEEAILKQRFGKRLVIRNHYLALNPARLNADLRLYLIAKGRGMGPQVANALMQSGLDERNPAQVRRVTGFVAKHFGLYKPFVASLSNKAFAKRVDAVDRSDGFVSQTPTLILNDQLEFGGRLGNIMTIITGVLKPAHKG